MRHLITTFILFLFVLSCNSQSVRGRDFTQSARDTIVQIVLDSISTQWRSDILDSLYTIQLDFADSVFFARIQNEADKNSGLVTFQPGEYSITSARPALGVGRDIVDVAGNLMIDFAGATIDYNYEIWYITTAVNATEGYNSTRAWTKVNGDTMGGLDGSDLATDLVRDSMWVGIGLWEMLVKDWL